jgi:hypothetical protein
MKKNGKWLASSVDPVREARQWSEVVLATTETIIVLGLGCGYHVVELMNNKPQSSLLIIECDSGVSEQALQICPSLVGATIIVEPDWTKLINYSPVRDALGGLYRVAKHLPSFAAGARETEYFNAVERMLLGRDKLSFLVLLKARPEILTLLDTDLLGDNERFQDEPVTIKAIQKLFAQRPNTSRERRLWRILEELVV